MNQLYPALEPYAIHSLQVGQNHFVHVEACGNPAGLPVLFLHGGPGSGCNPQHRRYFDPERYHILLFDQRGAGRSHPLGLCDDNKTSDLIADMEMIRTELKINQWLLFGGSWGATLALLYAQQYPQWVCGMILRGSFLAREEDLEWFFIGLRRLFPEQWERFTRDIENRLQLSSLIEWFYQALRSADKAIVLDAAQRWSDWGDTVVTWHHPNEERESVPEDLGAQALEVQQARLLAKVEIETHYARQRYFIEENAILDHAERLHGMPVSIVQGRFDLVCPMQGAWQLHRALPGSCLVEVPQAGHLISDPAMGIALLRETNRFRELLQRG